MSSPIKAGIDLLLWTGYGVQVPIFIPDACLHSIIIGGSGSGKSTFLLYYLYQIQKSLKTTNYADRVQKSFPYEFTICDFKRSGELKGITSHYAEFEECPSKIRTFYEEFLTVPEGGDGITRILIIDEIAGMLMHLGMTKEGKKEADEIRMILSSILMLGRSKRVFLILAMQRYTASIFPASSGAADNFHVCVGLGQLSVDSRRGLFAGEHFEGEDTLQFGMGKGIIAVDGKPLRGLQVPRVDKAKILQVLQTQNH